MNLLTNRLLLTTLDSAMRVKMLVSKDDIFKFDLGEAVAVYESSHPHNGQTPRLLAKLHKAVDEASTLPDKLSDGVDYADVGIDVDEDSENDELYVSNEDLDSSDEEWADTGVDPEVDLPDLSAGFSDDADDVPAARLASTDEDE